MDLNGFQIRLIRFIPFLSRINMTRSLLFLFVICLLSFDTFVSTTEAKKRKKKKKKKKVATKPEVEEVSLSRYEYCK